MTQKYNADFEVTLHGGQYFARVGLGKNGRYSNLPQLKIVFPLSIENGRVDFNSESAFHPVNGDKFDYNPEDRIAEVLAALELAAQRPIIRGIEINGARSFRENLVFKACSCSIFQSDSRDGAPTIGKVSGREGRAYPFRRLGAQ